MLKQEDALLTGLAVAAVVGGIYAVHVPTVAASRASAPGNMHIEASRKSATWTAAVVVVGASLLAKDPTVFVIGGVVVIALDFAHRYANAVNNQTGQVPSASSAAPASPVTG
jgi:4-amino-4-deoxy-L-arabinose transferase-like glycosyltransferase